MKLAVRKCSLTPLQPIIQGGYAAQRNRPFDYVNDEIEGRVFAIEVNGEKLVWVTADFTGLEEEIIDEILMKVRERGVELRKENFLINVSHTHCGPAANRKAMGGSRIVSSEEYIQYYENQLAGAICDAFRDPGVEVSTKISVFTIDGIYSNRNDINKPSNKNLYLIGFFRKDGALEGLLCSLSHHCTVLGPNFYGLSADLFGRLRLELEEKFNTTAAILQGSAGDMGNRQYRQGNDYGEVERETKNLMEQICWRLDWKDIDIDNYEISSHKYLARYHHSAEEYAEKIADFEKRLETEKDFDMIKLLQSGIGGFRRKQAVPSGDYEREMPYNIIKMNDLQIVTIPGEYGSFLALRV
ncbi:MAG: hypothetical protein II712_05565, partial [Erysipelotrichaceae bacterium]|nr:hypothetical protein [Erysipelotrichaceae bacterium]